MFADGSTTRPPGSTEIRQVDYLEGLKVGYRWYDAERIELLFPASRRAQRACPARRA